VIMPSNGVAHYTQARIVVALPRERTLSRNGQESKAARQAADEEGDVAAL
jgi:hypothetical protein